VPVVDVAGGEIHYEVHHGARRNGEPPLVFLHEGLGSVELWRDFPCVVSEATGRDAVVYSRHGYGRSAVVSSPRAPSYMHDEALRVLPDLLDRLDIGRHVLIGHSDGASIALIHAGSARGADVAGAVLLAPHVLVEDVSVAGIAAAREAFLTTDLPARLGRYHRDPASTFWGWNRIWLSPEFRSWNIEDVLPAVHAPLLVVQGEDDQYGTEVQVEAIERGSGGPVQRLVLAGCGHAPHLERRDETMAAVVRFVASCA
jgi:pimeloyl-ACP methyl ester carboxylesterase